MHEIHTVIAFENIIYRLIRKTGPTYSIEVKEYLDEHGRRPTALISALRSVKNAGRFYVNEHGVAFAPREHERFWDYVYLGTVDVAREWFPTYTP